MNGMILRETSPRGAGARPSSLDTRIVRHRNLARLDRRPVQHRHRLLRKLPMPQSLRAHERLARAQLPRHRPVVGQRRHLDLAIERQQQLVAIRMPLPRRLPRVAHHAQRQIPDLRDVAHGGVGVLAGRVRRDIEMRHLAQRGAQVMLLQASRRLTCAQDASRRARSSAADLWPPIPRCGSESGRTPTRTAAASGDATDPSGHTNNDPA